MLKIFNGIKKLKVYYFSDRVESMTLIFSTQEQKTAWEKCFAETKKTFCRIYFLFFGLIFLLKKLIFSS